VNPRASSSSSARRASSSEPSRKRGREEVPPPPPGEPEEVLPPLLTEPEEVRPPPPAEVKLPPLEEVKSPPPKEVKPPRHKVALHPVAVVCAPALNADKATWSSNLFHEAFMKLRKVAVHLGVPAPSHPLQMTVKDYAFKINVLVGDLERGVLAPLTTTAATMAASTSPDLALAPAPTPTVGLLQR
jgi:hypothetical protein